MKKKDGIKKETKNSRQKKRKDGIRKGKEGRLEGSKGRTERRNTA